MTNKNEKFLKQNTNPHYYNNNTAFVMIHFSHWSSNSKAHINKKCKVKALLKNNKSIASAIKNKINK